MSTRITAPPITLPSGWPRKVRSAVLHAISLAATALTMAWGRAATSSSLRCRQSAETDRLRTEIRLLEEELAIKDARWSRLPARRRPYYDPVQRMRVLKLRASRGWSVEQTAARFLVTEETIASWVRRVDEEGEHALVQIKEPVNKFPAFVGYLVRSLKLMCPTLGKVKIAQLLARAGLHLGATTVGRMLTAKPPRGAAVAATAVTKKRRVTAGYANHVWHTDLTVVPTLAGFWLSWLPYAWPQRWPFCWWVAVAIDHTSRLVVGFALFVGRPTPAEVCAFLDRAIKRVGGRPRYIVTDKGRQFFCRYFKRWCRRRGIKPRFGAVGKHGSIAIVERLIRSMKAECTRLILVPYDWVKMRQELGSYIDWHNGHRPHSALGGRTPLEVYRALPPANEAARLEPRRRWPRGSRCASPAAPVKGRRGSRLKLTVSHLDGRRHLPLVELKRAA